MTARYEILEDRTSWNLAKTVNAYLASGWQLQGGIAFHALETSAGLLVTYAQAMTYVEQPNEPDRELPPPEVIMVKEG